MMKRSRKQDTDDPQEAADATMAGVLPADHDQGTGIGAAAPVPAAAAETVAPGPAEAPTPGDSDQAAALQVQVADFKDRLLRARAELENYRKRVTRESEEIRASTKAMVLSELLNVFDHFEMALQHTDRNPDPATLRQGMDLILSEFLRAIDRLGVSRLEASGQAFDPTIHQAVAQEPSAEVPAGQVLRQWKCGYRLGERLVRPAVVVVSSGKPAATPSGEPAPETPSSPKAAAAEAS